MKYLVFVILLFFVSCGFTQKEVIEEQHRDGTPKKIVQYENGIKIKEFEFYFNGKKKKETSFKDSIKDGVCFVWYEYGNLQAKGNYEKGELNGLMVEYLSNGKKIREKLFEKGKLLVTTKYRPDGSKLTQINSIENKFFSWYETGQLMAEIPNVKGVNLEYYEDGSKKVEGIIKEGSQNGVWSYWDPSGKLIKEITFKDNVVMDSVIHITELANTIKSVWN